MSCGVNHHTHGESGRVWVTDDADGMDLLGVMGVLCDRWTYEPVEQCVAQITAGIRPFTETVQMQAPPTTFFFKRAGLPGQTWRCPTHHPRSMRALTHLECLAYAILSAHPVPMDVYRAWAHGGPAMQQRQLAAPELQPRTDLPSVLLRWFDEGWLACYRRGNRAVGPCWLLPFMALVLGWTPAIRALRIDRCPVRPGRCCTRFSDF